MGGPAPAATFRAAAAEQCLEAVAPCAHRYRHKRLRSARADKKRKKAVEVRLCKGFACVVLHIGTQMPFCSLLGSRRLHSL